MRGISRTGFFELKNMNSSHPSSAFFESFASLNFDAIVVLNTSGEVLYWNEAAERIFGYPASQILGQRVIDNVVPPAYRDQAKDALEQFVTQQTVKAEWHRLEFEAQRSQGAKLWVDVRACLFEDQSQARIATVTRDVDEIRRRDQELKRAATTDFLSGISNRREFQRILESKIDQGICLAILDVDHFKAINDEYGHLEGDQAIRHVSKSLVDHFPDAFCVARLGGEEFGVVLQVDEPDRAIERFEQYRQQFAVSEKIEMASNVTVSIGLAFNDSTKPDVRNLLTRADQALYQSKRHGRNQLTIMSAS